LPAPCLPNPSSPNLSELSQSSLQAGKAQLEASERAATPAASRIHLLAAKREWLCAVTDAAAALSERAMRPKAAVAADKELATKAWRRMLAALEHLASQSVPETDMPVKRLRLGLKNVSVPGEPLPLSDYRRAECHAPALRERGAVGCCERGLAA